MISLTLRQFRVPALVSVAAVVVIAVLLAVTGSHLHHLYSVYQAQVPACTANGGCDQLTANFLKNYHHLYQFMGTLLVALPCLIGLFWGPPLLAREFETGTHRLAWTQSVTRTRWLASKIGIVGLIAIVTSGLISAMFTWWAHPIDHVSANQFSGEIFSGRGLVPVGYTVFAFVLGASLGLLIRRTVPAMAVTLVAYVAVHLVVIGTIRPHLAAASHSRLPLRDANSFGFTGRNGAHFFASGANIPNSLVVSNHLVDNAGRTPSNQTLTAFLHTACPAIVTPPAGGPPNGNAFSDCLTKLSANFHLDVAFIPPSRYWDLQLAETGLYLVLAIGLAAVCFWWIRNRMS
jgi:ABC-type transport system involved in multi-copper enzyme maturation permease subunit